VCSDGYQKEVFIVAETQSYMINHVTRLVQDDDEVQKWCHEYAIRQIDKSEQEWLAAQESDDFQTQATYWDNYTLFQTNLVLRALATWYEPERRGL
jgi:hypothetical protein